MPLAGDRRLGLSLAGDLDREDAERERCLGLSLAGVAAFEDVERARRLGLAVAGDFASDDLERLRLLDVALAEGERAQDFGQSGVIAIVAVHRSGDSDFFLDDFDCELCLPVGLSSILAMLASKSATGFDDFDEVFAFFFGT